MFKYSAHNVNNWFDVASERGYLDLLSRWILELWTGWERLPFDHVSTDHVCWQYGEPCKQSNCYHYLGCMILMTARCASLKAWNNWISYATASVAVYCIKSVYHLFRGKFMTTTDGEIWIMTSKQMMNCTASSEHILFRVGSVRIFDVCPVPVEYVNVWNGRQPKNNKKLQIN